MPFRSSTYRELCVECHELASLLCGVCDAPVCEEHREPKMCNDCGVDLDRRLSAKGLTRDDLRFRPVPPDTAHWGERKEWEAHSERVYRAKFAVARFLRQRKGRYQRRSPLE